MLQVMKRYDGQMYPSSRSLHLVVGMRFESFDLALEFQATAEALRELLPTRAGTCRLRECVCVCVCVRGHVLRIWQLE